MTFMENEVSVQDLISLSYEQKPIEFQQAFNDLLSDRIAAAVDARKVEIASSLYSGETDEEEETVTDTDITDQEEDTDGETA
jgi:hypothetical protein